jgi:hypothetical protein
MDHLLCRLYSTYLTWFFHNLFRCVSSRLLKNLLQSLNFLSLTDQLPKFSLRDRKWLWARLREMLGVLEIIYGVSYEYQSHADRNATGTCVLPRSYNKLGRKERVSILHSEYDIRLGVV